MVLCCSFIWRCCCKGCGGTAKSAKFAYLFLVFIACLIATLLRYTEMKIDFGALGELDCNDDRCDQIQGVYRISFSGFVFYAGMSLLTFFCAYIHINLWMLKIFLYFVLIIVAYSIPNDFYDGYVEFARVASALFILLQIVILINFSYSLHETIMENAVNAVDNPETCYTDGCWKAVYLIFCFVCLGSSITGIVLMYKFYGDCDLNIFFITFTLITGILYTMLSIWDRIDIGLLTPSVVWLYCTYLCWQALQNHPYETCNPYADNYGGVGQGWYLFFAFLVLGVSLVWTAWRTAKAVIDFSNSSIEDSNAKYGEKDEKLNAVLTGEQTTNTLEIEDGKKKDKEDNEELDERFDGEEPEFLWLFHLVLALAMAYLAMMLTNWGAANGDNPNESKDTGFESMWLKIVSQWIATILFIWTLVAPMLRGE